MKSLLVLSFSMLVASAAVAGNTLFGLKSNQGTGGGASAVPTRLFSFDGTTGVVNDIAWVTYNGNQVDADGLSYGGGNLYAFVLEQAGSRLVTLDSMGVATSVAFYQGTVMRGATYRNGRIYALDVLQGSQWNIATIDVSTLLLTSVALNTTISDACDIDYDATGALWLAESNAFFLLDPNTGIMNLTSVDNLPEPLGGFVFNAGFAFDETSPGRAVTLDVNFTDDLNTYFMPGPVRTPLSPNILLNFNAGRGDLAAVPEPTTVAAVGMGLVALLRRRRR